MMIIDEQNFNRMKFPAWQLALSLIPYIATVVTGVLGFVLPAVLPTDMSFNEITPEIMEAIRLPWAFISLFTGIGALNGSAAIFWIASFMRKSQARYWMLVTMIVSAALIVITCIDIIFRLVVVDFRDAMLGDNLYYSVATMLGSIAVPMLFLVTSTCCVGLVLTGISRKAGLVIGILSGLLFLASVIPGVSRSMPPFIFGLLWMPMGISLLLHNQHTVSQSKVVLTSS